MGCIANIFFGILQSIALVLVVVGTPLDQFRSKGAEKEAVNISSYFKNTYCVTYWGVKDKCYSLTYNGRPQNIFKDCKGRLPRFRASEVCSIITIAAIVAALILFAVAGCCSCCSPCCKYIVMLFNFIAVITGAIAWGCMLDCYRRNMGNSTLAESRTTTTTTAAPLTGGTGFGPSVTMETAHSAVTQPDDLVFDSWFTDGDYVLTVDQCMKMKDYTGTDGTLQYGLRLGAGWILTIVGWAVTLINAFIILIPC